jgi:hypothetical protein
VTAHQGASPDASLAGASNIKPLAKPAAIIEILVVVGISFDPSRIACSTLPLTLAAVSAESLLKDALHGGNRGAQNDV